MTGPNIEHVGSRPSNDQRHGLHRYESILRVLESSSQIEVQKKNLSPPPPEKDQLNAVLKSFIILPASFSIFRTNSSSSPLSLSLHPCLSRVDKLSERSLNEPGLSPRAKTQVQEPCPWLQIHCFLRISMATESRSLLRLLKSARGFSEEGSALLNPS